VTEIYQSTEISSRTDGDISILGIHIFIITVLMYSTVFVLYLYTFQSVC